MKKEYFIEHRQNLKCGLHVNAELEIVLVIDGSLAIKTDGGKIRELSGGQAMLILPHHVHAFSPESGVNARVMMFSHALIEQFYEKFRHCDFSENVLQVEKPLLDFCEYVLDKYKQTEDIYCVKSLFFAFASAFSSLDLQAEKSSVKSVNVTQIMEFVYSNLGEKLTILSLSKALAINKNALGKIFIEYTGVPFGKFLHNMRVEKSVMMLRTTDKTVTDVAYECGFGSLRTFNRVFSSIIGVTPSVFRKNLQV